MLIKYIFFPKHEFFQKSWYYLKQSSSAAFRTALAVDFFSLDLIDDVSVVPAELLAGGNVTLGEEGDPRKAQVVSVDETVLHEDVRSARVVEVAADVADFFRVHDVDVLVFSEKFSGRDVFRFIVGLGFVSGAGGRAFRFFVPAPSLSISRVGGRNGNGSDERSVRFFGSGHFVVGRRRVDFVAQDVKVAAVINVVLKRKLLILKILILIHFIYYFARYFFTFLRNLQAKVFDENCLFQSFSKWMFTNQIYNFCKKTEVHEANFNIKIFPMTEWMRYKIFEVVMRQMIIHIKNFCLRNRKIIFHHINFCLRDLKNCFS